MDVIVSSPMSRTPAGFNEEHWRLGYLRPRDEFYFVLEVPYEGIDLLTRYRILPCSRGFLKFSDGEKAVYTVPLDYAFGIRVKSGENFKDVRKYYFYPGDRVKSKESGALGHLIRSHGQGYLVRFDHVDEYQWVADGMISLIEKEKTTRKYLYYGIDDDVFVVAYADVRSEHETAVGALEFLHKNHRAGFHRLSLLISRINKNMGIDVWDDLAWVDADCLAYLLKNDRRVWDESLVEKIKGIFDEEDVDAEVQEELAGEGEREEGGPF